MSMMPVVGRCVIVLEEGLFAYAVYVFGFHFLPFNSNVPVFSNYENLHIALGAVFALLFVMCQWCFLRASFGDPGFVSDKVLQEHNVESMTTERKRTGETRKCTKCKKPKPDRAHHCSVCNRCVLKMDHHCPFINNCVGFRNYKYFFIFIFWTLSFCLFMIACVAYHEYRHFVDHDDDPHYLDYYEISAAGICAIIVLLLIILFVNHVKFVLRNLTTIEHVEKKRDSARHPFNLGFRRNFVQVFGSNPFLWLLPIWSTQGDGITYPLQMESSSLLAHT